MQRRPRPAVEAWRRGGRSPVCVDVLCGAGLDVGKGRLLLWLLLSEFHALMEDGDGDVALA